MIQAPKEPPIEVLYCYAREDEKYLEKLDKQLAILKRQRVIDRWYDRLIDAGQDWDKEIKKHLDTADIILLLVSPDFINSDYCSGIEVERAMQRYNNGVATVIPIILRPALWQDAPFGIIQVLPKDAKPISTWTNEDEAFLSVAEGIRAASKKLMTNPARRSLVETPSSISASSSTTNAVNRFSPIEKTTQDWLKLGKKFFEREEYEEALEIYEQVIYLKPDMSAAYYYKANMLYYLKRYRDALIISKLCTRSDPSNSAAYYMRGNILYQLQEYKEAIRFYDITLRSDKVLLDMFHANNTKVDSMIAACCSKGNALFHLGQHTEANATYDILIAEESKTHNISEQKNANTVYKHLFHLKQDSIAPYMLQQKNANIVLEHFIHLNRDDIAPYWGKAYLYKHRESYDWQREHSIEPNILSTYNEIIRIAPNEDLAYREKAQILGGLGRREEALNTYEQIIQLNPHDDLAYREKAQILGGLGRREEALNTYEQIIQLNPHDDLAYRNKARLLESLGRREEALDTYEQIIQLNPHNTSNYTIKIHLLEDLERWEEALDTCEQVIQLNLSPSSTSAGKVQSRTSSYRDRVLIKRASRNNSGDISAYLTKASLLEKLGRVVEALDTYEQVIQLNPSNSLVYRDKARLLRNWRQEEALESYKQALRTTSPYSSELEAIRKERLDLLKEEYGWLVHIYFIGRILMCVMLIIIFLCIILSVVPFFSIVRTFSITSLTISFIILVLSGTSTFLLGRKFSYWPYNIISLKSRAL